MQNQSNWWSVYKEGKFQVISWHCNEYNPRAEIYLEYLLTKKWDPFMHSFSTTTADSGIPNWGEKKGQDYYNSMKLDICKQTN